jgi:hypothetical protein
LILEMRVRHLPPEQPERRHSMRTNPLQLVVPEDSAKATTDGSSELSGIPAVLDAAIGRLRFVSDDEGATPDDAA